MAIAPEIIRFGRWQLDLQRRALCADGVPVPLKGRAFDLLALLVAHPGQRVSNEEIFANVWPGITVGENNLRVQIRNLRVALGDEDSDGGGLIVTVQRGYKFAGEVETPTISHAPAALTAAVEPLTLVTPAVCAPNIVATRRAGWGTTTSVLAAALILVLATGASFVWRQTPLPPRLSIAVLPFRNLSPDHAQDYLADALTDDLTTDLSHIPGSTVIARESADVWRGKPTNVQQIGRALMVRYLLEGSLRAEDGQYHVNAQLIDAQSGTHLWAERLDFPNGTISEVRNTIVGRLAPALDFKLTQVESARSIHDRPDSPDALDLFFQARAIVDSDNSLLALTRVQHLLERALLQAPDFSDAAAELGTVLMMKVAEADDPQESADIAEAHLQITNALNSSPRNVLALTARARELLNKNEWVEASSSARAALAIDPSSVVAHIALARCARAGGKLEEAANEIMNVLRLSPYSVSSKRYYVSLGFIRLMQFRTKDAIDSLLRSTVGDDNGKSQDTMGRVEVAQILLIAATAMDGNLPRARAMYLDYNKAWPNRTAWRFADYYPREEAKSPGFSALMTALQNAGMPLYATDNTTMRSQVDTCGTGDFAPTPEGASNVETWSTEDLRSHISESTHLLILDLGHGAAVPPGAVWSAWGTTAETSQEFAKRTVKEKWSDNIGALVVVMGDGMYGCDAYKAAVVIASAFPRLIVKWYRGGEEAWAAAGLPFNDNRP